MDRNAYDPVQRLYRPSTAKALYFGQNDEKDIPEPPKDKGIFLTHEEMKAKRTPQQKKDSLAWDMVTRFTNSKLDLGIILFTAISLFIPPLQLISVPIFIGRSIVRYAQGKRTPIAVIDAYWDELAKGKNPNLYKFRKTKLKEFKTAP